MNRKAQLLARSRKDNSGRGKFSFETHLAPATKQVQNIRQPDIRGPANCPRTAPRILPGGSMVIRWESNSTCHFWRLHLGHKPDYPGKGK